MEQYINLLSDSIPGWIGEKPDVSNKPYHLELSFSFVFLGRCCMEPDVLFDIILIAGQ